MTSPRLGLLLVVLAAAGRGGDSESAPPPLVERIAQELALASVDSVIVFVPAAAASSPRPPGLGSRAPTSGSGSAG